MQIIETPQSVMTVEFPEYMTGVELATTIRKGQKALYDLIMTQGSFLTQNWMQVLASSSYRGSTPCVRVGADGVITLTDERVLIRLRAPGCPSGFYIIKDEDTLRTRGPDGVIHFTRSNRAGFFRDERIVMPDFEALGRLNPARMDAELAQHFIQWCHAVKSYGVSIVITADRAYVNGLPHDTEKSFNFNFNLAEPVLLKPENLISAFKECMRYDYFFIGRELDDGKPRPLVLGRNWAYCTLVATEGIFPFTD